MKYKDKNNIIHEVEAGFEHLLPSDAVALTPEQEVIWMTPILDTELKEAWDNTGSLPVLNLDKAKELVHEKRRVKRDAAFQPNINIIDKHVKGIPLKADEDVEVARKANASVKTKDDALQSKIDKCRSEKTLRKLMIKEKL